MDDVLRGLIALVVTAVVLYLAANLLVWPALFLLFVGGTGGLFLLIIILIVLAYFVFVGLFNGMGGESPAVQKQEAMAYQRRRHNMPPPEPPSAERYDFQMLSAFYHLLQWLNDAPFAYICNNIEKMLRRQVADSRLLDITATSKPQWQTVTVREEENGQTITTRRTGVAFEFLLHVFGNGKTHELRGVYTWAGSRLNLPPAEQRQQSWLDLNGTLADFGGGKLAERLNAAD